MKFKTYRYAKNAKHGLVHIAEKGNKLLALTEGGKLWNFDTDFVQFSDLF